MIVLTTKTAKRFGLDGRPLWLEVGSDAIQLLHQHTRQTVWAVAMTSILRLVDKWASTGVDIDFQHFFYDKCLHMGGYADPPPTAGMARKCTAL